MQRRKFVQIASATALALPIVSCSQKISSTDTSVSYQELVHDLVKTWCDSLIKLQINKPDNVEEHGAMSCPSCDFIHARCMDSVYPLLYLADKTGDQKYVKAAIEVFNWADQNVSTPEGAWTVIPDPKSWKGITVFGAMSVAEALKYHGHVLPKAIHNQWRERLSKAAEYIYQNFTIAYSHINYAFSAIYALHLLGHMYDRPDYLAKSKAFAAEIPNWLTSPNKLLYGEDSPMDKRSAKGLPSVDLGYNVEETLNSMVLYAVEVQDKELIKLLTESLEGHLKFMLPDGAWDNSWGTRQNKWSYWGSRTTEGSAPAYAFMADQNPAFGTAALLHIDLLHQLTRDGLLTGGPHFKAHNVATCMHHTFPHAKALTILLDKSDIFKKLSKKTPLPVIYADGIKHFTEIDVWQAARGPWRASVSSYDNVFKTKYSQQATGGTIGTLWHNKVGLLMAASMAEYMLAEKNNQQSINEKDIASSVRLETYHEDVWYTNLHDLKTEVSSKDMNGIISFDTIVHLVNREKINHPSINNLSIQYVFDQTTFTIIGKIGSNTNDKIALVTPIISSNDEVVTKVSSKEWIINKGKHKLKISANAPLQMKPMEQSRAFNLVPGVEFLPIYIDQPDNDGVLKIEITVS